MNPAPGDGGLVERRLDAQEAQLEQLRTRVDALQRELQKLQAEIPRPVVWPGQGATAGAAWREAPRTTALYHELVEVQQQKSDLAHQLGILQRRTSELEQELSTFASFRPSVLAQQAHRLATAQMQAWWADRLRKTDHFEVLISLHDAGKALESSLASTPDTQLQAALAPVHQLAAALRETLDQGLPAAPSPPAPPAQWPSPGPATGDAMQVDPSGRVRTAFVDGIKRWEAEVCQVVQQYLDKCREALESWAGRQPPLARAEAMTRLEDLAIRAHKALFSMCQGPPHKSGPVPLEDAVRRVLRALSVEAVVPGPGDSYDPLVHLPVSTRTDSSYPYAAVTNLLEPGYRKGTDVIFKARVHVSMGRQ